MSYVVLVLLAILAVGVLTPGFAQQATSEQPTTIPFTVESDPAPVQTGNTTAPDPAPVQTGNTTAPDPAPVQTGNTTAPDPAPVQTGNTTAPDPAPVQTGTEQAPPVKQMREGIALNQIQCNDQRILLESPAGKPVCVFDGTVEKLSQRGWDVVGSLEPATDTPTESISEEPADQPSESITDTIAEPTTNTPVEEPATNTVENSTTNTVENSTTNTVENSTTNTVENSTTNTVENSTTNTVENSTTNTVENSTTNIPVEEPATDTPTEPISEEPADQPSESITDTVEKPATDTPTESSSEETADKLITDTQTGDGQIIYVSTSSPVEFVHDGREIELSGPFGSWPWYDKIMNATWSPTDIDQQGIISVTSPPHEKYSFNQGVGFYVEDWMPTVIPDGQKVLYAETDFVKYKDKGTRPDERHFLRIQFVPTSFVMTEDIDVVEIIRSNGFSVHAKHSTIPFPKIGTYNGETFGNYVPITRDGKNLVTHESVFYNNYRANITFLLDENTKIYINSNYHTLEELFPVFDSIMQ